MHLLGQLPRWSRPAFRARRAQYQLRASVEPAEACAGGHRDWSDWNLRSMESCFEVTLEVTLRWFGGEQQ